MNLLELLFETPKFKYLLLVLEDARTDATKKLTEQQKEKFNEVLSIEPVLPPKYYKWIVANYASQSLMMPAQEVYDMLDLFDSAIKSNLLQNKDINSKQYDSLQKLQTEVIEASSKTSKTKIKRTIKSEGSKKIYEDKQYLVIIPETESASCFYGTGTKWCISATESKNYFDHYTDQGIKFIFIINKKEIQTDPYSKIAIAHVPNRGFHYEIYDSKDKSIEASDVLDKFPKIIVDKINQYFKDPVLPSSYEEEIQSLSREKYNRIVKTQIELLNDTNNEDNEIALEKKLLSYINYADIDNLSIFAVILSHPNDYKELTSNYSTSNFLTKAIKNRIIQLSDGSPEKIIELYNNVGFRQDYIAGIIDIPINKIISILETSKNITLIRTAVYKNAINLGIALTGRNTGINYFVKFPTVNNIDFIKDYLLSGNRTQKADRDILSQRIEIEPEIHNLDISEKAVDNLEKIIKSDKLVTITINAAKTDVFFKHMGIPEELVVLI